MTAETNRPGNDRTDADPIATARKPDDLPSSLHAIIGLARAVRSGEPDPGLERLSRDRLDWIEVITLADRCRILPLLISGIRVQDPGVLESGDLAELADFMVAHGERCDLLIATLERSLAGLAKAGIPAVTYKGPVLSKTVYGDYRMRDFRDLDIMVPHGKYESAIAEMQRLGYQIDEFMGAECHLITQTSKYPLVVDLHNGLADIYLPLSRDIDRLWQDLRTIDLGGHRILTFRPEGHLFVSCLHLVKEWHNHAPFLQYALDIVVLLDERPARDWCDLLETARTYGVEAYAKLAFSVAARLLDRDCPVTWKDGQEDALRAVCERLLADLPETLATDKPPATRFYSALSIGVRRALAPSLRSWLASELRLLRTQLFFIDDHDREWLPLPAGLHGLYWVLRPVRLSSRVVKRCLGVGN